MAKKLLKTNRLATIVYVPEESKHDLDWYLSNFYKNEISDWGYDYKKDRYTLYGKSYYGSPCSLYDPENQCCSGEDEDADCCECPLAKGRSTSFITLPHGSVVKEIHRTIMYLFYDSLKLVRK